MKKNETWGGGSNENEKKNFGVDEDSRFIKREKEFLNSIKNSGYCSLLF
jgi:hypothetical protein